MKTNTHGNGNGMDDLYILPDSHEESQRIVKYLRKTDRSFYWSRSDVEEHEWHGRSFIDIPFGGSLLNDIRAALLTQTRER